MTATPPKPSQWISVEERLPEVGRLVILVYGGYIVYVGRLNDAGKWQLNRGTLVDSVTYWMPLPNPPNAGLADETEPKENKISDAKNIS